MSAGLPTTGVFLPYTPLHRMLLDRADRPLVMTSGNATDEPIAIGNDEAMSRLRGIADLFLLHDREVVQRSDDSVVRRVGRGIYPIRRARGFVPAPVTLPRSFPDVVGLGGELKSTFCFIKGDAAYLSQHLGDLEQSPVRDFYEEAYRFFRRFLDARPRAACHDLHPAYFTTSFADRAGADRLFALQHHKAHIYSALAETGFAGKAVGVAFDGTGYGEDGTIWGGEFFAVDGMEVRRAGHLGVLPPPRRGCRRPGAVADRPLPAAETLGARGGGTGGAGALPRHSPGLGPPGARGAGEGDQRGADLQRGPALRRRLRDLRVVRPVELRGTGADAPGGRRRARRRRHVSVHPRAKKAGNLR